MRLLAFLVTEPLPVTEMINEQDFISYLTVKEGSSVNTIRHCRIRLRIINKWFFNQDLTKQTVEAFFLALREKGLSNAGINTYFLVFKYLEKYLKDRNRLTDPFLDGMSALPKIRIKPIELLSKEQVESLIENDVIYHTKKGRDGESLVYTYKVFTAALAYTGARFSEMATLKVMYVNLTVGKIVFSAMTTKTKTERSVFITEPLISMLTPLVKNKSRNDYVFTNTTGHTIREGEYHEDLKKRAILSGITSRVHPHLFRHTYATNLYIATKDIGLVQIVLGHKDIKSTMIYIQLADDVIKNGMLTHPFIRQHVSPATTITAVEKQLATYQLDNDSRFDYAKVKEAVAEFLGKLHNAALSSVTCLLLISHPFTTVAIYHK